MREPVNHMVETRKRTEEEQVGVVTLDGSDVRVAVIVYNKKTRVRLYWGPGSHLPSDRIPFWDDR